VNLTVLRNLLNVVLARIAARVRKG